MNPYDTLGIPRTATVEDAKAAYRKLAMQHHPDRGGNAARFAEIKSAWESIETGTFQAFKPAQPSSSFRNRPKSPPTDPQGTWRSNIFDEFKQATKSYNPYGGNGGMNQQYGDVVAKVSMREAFLGFNMIIPKAKSNAHVHVTGGMPNGYRGDFPTSDNSTKTVIVAFDHAPFKLRDVDPSPDNSDWNRNPGDTELTVDIDAIDVITGTWLTVKDFLGESLQVRVPAGHNPLHPLRISNKGYMGWDMAMQQPSGKRADMYLRLNVIFNPPASIEKQKIVNLYNQIKDA